MAKLGHLVCRKEGPEGLKKEGSEGLKKKGGSEGLMEEPVAAIRE